MNSAKAQPTTSYHLGSTDEKAGVESRMAIQSKISILVANPCRISQHFLMTDERHSTNRIHALLRVIGTNRSIGLARKPRLCSPEKTL